MKAVKSNISNEEIDRFLLICEDNFHVTNTGFNELYLKHGQWYNGNIWLIDEPMTEKEKFDIILSKNRLAKNIKYMLDLLKIKESQILLYDLEQIEKLTGTSNQPGVREIFENPEID